jgi:RimJ/RimL family protein N-acetyltransferase
MFDVLSDPAIYEFENEPPASQEWLTRRFERLEQRRSPDGKDQWLNWIIRLPDGAAAGYVQATVLPSATAYVAYELNSRYWRRGIGGSAVSAMLDELRLMYGVEVFMAILKAGNFRSRELLRSLGFSMATSAEIADHRSEPDEIVMTRAAGR